MDLFCEKIIERKLYFTMSSNRELLAKKLISPTCFTSYLLGRYLD